MRPSDGPLEPRRKAIAGLGVALLLAVTAADGCGPAGPRAVRAEAPPAQAVAFRSLDAGTHSGVTGAQEVVVLEGADWERLWQAHQSGRTPPPPRPAVDFAREMVVAVFLGERPTGGFQVQIERIVESPRALEVLYRVIQPPPGAITTQALTQPFHIVAVQRRPDPVRFRRLAP